MAEEEKPASSTETKEDDTNEAASPAADKESDETQEDSAVAAAADESGAGEKPPSSSSEERIRGGGKVTTDRGGRNTRRHQPYSERNTNHDGGGHGRHQEGERGCRVYVGNLSWNVSWQDLKDHMKTTGLDVARANIMTTPEGRSKGCGIVEFTTPEGAQQAVLTLNDTELNGRNIFVREDREDRGGPRPGGPGAHAHANHHNKSSGNRFTPGERNQSRRVYVGNLSWDVRWQELKDHMRQAGEVLHAEVISESNGRSKGCGIVEFATADQAQEAITTLTDSELRGRLIFVREDRETSSGAATGFQGHQRGAENCSVYVWNLTYETSWQDLKDHMRKAGNVDQATILTDAQGNSIGCSVVVYQRPQEAARAIRELHNSELHGRNIYIREDRNHGAVGGGGGGRGFGAGGRHAQGNHGHHHHHGGRHNHQRGGPGGQSHAGRTHTFTVGPDTTSSNSHGGSSLFVNNLSYDTSWQDLKDHFRQCGDVERAEVMTNAEGRSKGFGTVRFVKDADAETAIERLNGQDLQGRTLEVRYDTKSR